MKARTIVKYAVAALACAAAVLAAIVLLVTADYLGLPV